MIRYDGLGLDNVWLVNGYIVENEGGMEFVVVEHLEALEKAVALFLAKVDRPLQGQEFRFLREQLDQSQTTMGLKVGREYQTVARWELAGRRPVPQFAAATIRQLYLESAGEHPRFTDIVNSIINAVERAVKEAGVSAAEKAVKEAGVSMEETPQTGWQGSESRVPELA